MKKVVRKGVFVKYVGNDQHLIDAWGKQTFLVHKKTGDSAVGYFPVRYGSGSIHLCKYSVPLKDLEIVHVD